MDYPHAEPSQDDAVPAGNSLISLVIPVYNEEESLSPLLKEIRAVFAELDRPWEVILVDDGSSDGSWRVICELSRSQPEVRGLRFRRNFGKAAALQAGFSASRGDLILTLDADLQDDPREIPRFITALGEGYDLVSGWKKIRHDPWHKVLPSRVFNWLVSKVTGVYLHDHNCGFKAYRVEVIRTIRLYGELHRFVPVLAAAEGFRVGELIVRHRPRTFGHSKFGVSRFIKGFLDLVAVRFVSHYGRRPMHYFGTLGFIGIVLGLFLFGLILLFRLLSEASCLDLGISALSELALLFAGGSAIVLGTQSLMLGMLSELVASRLAPGEPPYRLWETVPDSRQ